MFRTINESFREIAKVDPDTAITKHFIRKLAADGQIATVKVGVKILVDYLDLQNYLNQNKKNKGDN